MEQENKTKDRLAGPDMAAREPEEPVREDLPRWAPAIGREELLQFTRLLQEYKAGKTRTEQRIIDSENWWKLRSAAPRDDGLFRSVSGWLHNVITSKHADAMDAYPEPVILPREADDRQEAAVLSKLIPCILEQNEFEGTYSDAMWQKMKTGTGLYKVVWDKNLLNGLGDIRVEKVNLLNVFWEPGVTDIQKSRAFFQTELIDREVLLAKYPHLEGSLKDSAPITAKFLYDDTVPTDGKVTVVEVYYRRHRGGRRVLHYCRYVGDQVLFATENMVIPQPGPEGQRLPPMAETGLYDHGLYPYVFDPLFPIEGSPCGYGYVDLCRNPQTEIDLLKTSFVRNALVGATPRYFSRVEGNVKEAEFLDLTKPIVHVAGNVDEASLRQIGAPRLDGSCLSVLDRTIQELRETSGNTETATGNIHSGVTAASAIAALQEASGKGSRDSTLASYRAYSRIVNLCIELIRQFYTLPRQFRILGRGGTLEYISYTNRHLVLQPQHNPYGLTPGSRKPVFDIRVSAQKRSAYSRFSQNELALQLYKLGFFEPGRAAQSRQCLELMDFEGKEELLRQLETAEKRQALLGLLARQTAGAGTGLTPPPPALTKGAAQAASAPRPEDRP